jgi:hypothetical protein
MVYSKILGSFRDSSIAAIRSSLKGEFANLETSMISAKSHAGSNVASILADFSISSGSRKTNSSCAVNDRVPFLLIWTMTVSASSNSETMVPILLWSSGWSFGRRRTSVPGRSSIDLINGVLAAGQQNAFADDVDDTGLGDAP